jgi:hypothetical protein
MKFTKLSFVLACMVGLMSGEASAVTPTTGEFVFNFTITVSSTISTSTTIGCIVEVEVSGDKTTPGIQEIVGSAATRTGNTATCTVDVPYSWNLGNPSTDKVTLLYTIEAPVLGGAYAVPYRQSHEDIGTIAVPSTGTTTTETIAATI